MFDLRQTSEFITFGAEKCMGEVLWESQFVKKNIQ